MTVPPTASLHEAKAWLRDRVDDGAECPCCTQLAKVYRRSIHASMASALIVAYRHAGLDYAYLPDTLNHRQNADFAKLAYWGLIDPELGERDDGSKRTGRWRVTWQGALFARDKVLVPKHARVYDGRCLGLVGDLVGIRECLGNRFDYNELMAAQREAAA